MPVQPLATLRPDPENARRHPARNRALLEDSLREVGAGRAIVIDEGDTILAGNAIAAAAQAVGIERVRVIEVDGETVVAVRRRNLTAAQKQRLALYDNRTAELAEWDEDQLARLRPTPALDGLFREDELNAVAGLAPLAPADPDLAATMAARRDELLCPACGQAFLPEAAE